jgi:hypothetical protein
VADKRRAVKITIKSYQLLSTLQLRGPGAQKCTGMLSTKDEYMVCVGLIRASVDAPKGEILGSSENTVFAWTARLVHVVYTTSRDDVSAMKRPTRTPRK